MDEFDTIHAVGRAHRSHDHAGLYYIRKKRSEPSFSEMGILANFNPVHSEGEVEKNKFYDGTFMKLSLDRNDWLYLSYFYSDHVIYIVSKNRGISIQVRLRLTRLSIFYVC